MRRILLFSLLGLSLAIAGLYRFRRETTQRAREAWVEAAAREVPDSPRPSADTSFPSSLTAAALALTKQAVVYDPAYRKILYPGGDVPADRGVCSDVVIRAYRRLGIDLQKEVHEDMAASFSAYPRLWGLKRPDPNIDHRRVPNLMTFFGRRGAILPKSRQASDYAPGDIVAWDLGGGITHIGIAVGGEKIVHNVGQGQVSEEVLFAWPVIGHYRYPVKGASGVHSPP